MSTSDDAMVYRPTMAVPIQQTGSSAACVFHPFICDTHDIPVSVQKPSAILPTLANVSYTTSLLMIQI